MSGDENELRLQGAPVSEGIAIGIPYFWGLQQDEIIPEFSIAVGEVEDEIARYRRALFSSREDLEKLQIDLVGEGSADAITIIDTHIQMLEDPMMTTHMEEKIRQMRQNTESVFRSVINEYEQKFAQRDSFFQQRLIDVMDLSKRILGHLNQRKKLFLSDVPPNSIVFTRELIPSDTAAVHATRVSAFVTQVGGGNTHAALIARAKGIPYVASVDLQQLQDIAGKCVIVDGLTGDIIINPAAETLEKYQKLKERLKSHYHFLEREVHLSAETMDGYAVHVYANVGSLNELDTLNQQGASGIGLFRTEYLFLQNESLFVSETGQLEIYRALLEKTKGMPVVIRVFDIGADKCPDMFIEQQKEPNPVLGCRGIRFLRRHKDIFRRQLRAILRASPHGEVRLLLPLVSDIHELLETKQLIQEIKDELIREGVEGLKDIPLGCMIEVPSAVMICDALAKECDFLAIGTNDLVQYTLGVDRSNSGVSDIYFPAHLSIIRMIKMIVVEGKRHRRPVSICGEIASNPLFVPLLLGLGINAFSCAPRYIPGIKRMIRQSRVVDCYQLAERVLSLSNSSEISQLLLDEYRKHIPEES